MTNIQDTLSPGTIGLMATRVERPFLDREANVLEFDHRWTLPSRMDDSPLASVDSLIFPFVVADIFRLGVLIAFPSISLLLPRYLG